MDVRTAVIAVAGLGTRFLPATKVVAKELLPIVDKPIVQHLVEEAAASGVRNVVLVTRPSERAIREHFVPNRQLEMRAASNVAIENKLLRLNELCKEVTITQVEQSSSLPYGNGSPLLAAKSSLKESEAVLYMFGDDLVLSAKPCSAQLIDLYKDQCPMAVVAAQHVPRHETSRYGIVKVKTGTMPAEMDSIVEKPRPDEAPSTLAQFGRFVLPYKVINILEQLPLGKQGELWLADAVDKLCRESRVLVKEIEGTWFTTGDPLRFLIASIEFALQDPELEPELSRYLKRLIVQRE